MTDDSLEVELRPATAAPERTISPAPVALVFMHLIRGPARTWLAAGVGLFWLGIMVALMTTDYLTRPATSF